MNKKTLSTAITSFLVCILLPVALVSAQSNSQSTISNCTVTKIGNPSKPPVIPVFCEEDNNTGSGGDIEGDARSLAGQILANKKIKLLNSSRKDIEAVRDGRRIKNSDSCGNSVTVHPALLKLMLQLAQNHTYQVWNIITEHGCDPFYHPRGRAMDIGQADGKNSWQNASFRQDAANFLPSGGTLLQTYCPGTPQVKPRRKLIQGDDGCNHQHIDVGIEVK